MRHCVNEHPNVFESAGDNLAELLREAADQIDLLEGWFAVTVGSGQEDLYVVGVYHHV